MPSTAVPATKGAAVRPYAAPRGSHAACAGFSSLHAATGLPRSCSYSRIPGKEFATSGGTNPPDRAIYSNDANSCPCPDLCPGSAWSAARQPINPGPVAFEPNRGQDATGADFVAYGDGFALSVAGGPRRLGGAGRAHFATVLAGARKTAPGVAESPLPGVVNYFKGEDRSRWITGIPRYGRVRYRGVYPGVDLVYYGNAGKLECDFAVAPGADPGAIRLRYEGARGLRVDAAGDLTVETAGGDLRVHRPVVYQDIDGARREIAGSYRIQGRTVAFAVAPYDRGRALVIDPVLTWSTFVAYSGSPEVRRARAWRRTRRATST